MENFNSQNSDIFSKLRFLLAMHHRAVCLPNEIRPRALNPFTVVNKDKFSNKEFYWPPDSSGCFANNPTFRASFTTNVENEYHRNFHSLTKNYRKLIKPYYEF